MRRSTFLAALALLGVSALCRASHAGQSLKILIPANPGGGWDATGHALGQALLAEHLIDAVSYQHKGGAAGTLGLAQFVNAYQGDPNAVMMTGSVMLGGILSGRPPVALSMATPLARLTTEYNVFVLPASSTLNSMPEVMAQLKRDPASVKWAGGSRGATEHIAAAMMAHHMGVDPARVNYLAFRGGGEAAAAVLGGEVTVGGSGYSEFAEYIAAGKMKPIAVTSPQRLPGVSAPTLTELGIPVVIGNWRGVYGAPGISPTQKQFLTGQVQAAVRSESWQRQLKASQWIPALLTGKEFEAFVARDFAALRSMMQKAGMI